ncbi:zinc-binding dehydrogenase [Pedobacter petrophilus]|uniref:Zinc-binding dehydrogenase n=1 Tax=Pedobacter petrophilus TaxID=1908241 RepID=A0A7K0G171_9SPHI|nr:NAD(P)H-quinone oxidoreductase [Pedobacter petrophilus]MRX77593.1 zinc-binding dehydrogenase [Pedobacter petrophilus]
MKAVKITKPGNADVLQLVDYPDPIPADGEILIEVMAAGLNRPDIFQREGNYPAPAGAPADIPGLEVAGIVKSCGSNANKWKIGDRVCALLAGGGYADYVAVKETQCLPIPAGFDFAQAATLPETVFTVWSNVFQRGLLKAGENLLIHGGSGGIGITAIQLARAFGAKVFVTVSSDKKGKACLELGADVFVNYKNEDFAKKLAEEGMDVILDSIGGSYLDKNVSILRNDGRLVHINAIEGKNTNLDIWKLMVKRLTITGSTLRARDTGFKAKLTSDILENVWPKIEAGKFKPVIYKTLPFDQAADAHRLLESGDHIGKIVLVK